MHRAAKKHEGKIQAHPARLQRRSSPGRRRAQWILTGWAALGRRREQPAENLEKAAAASEEREVTKGGRVGVTLKVHHPHPCSPQLDMQETWSKQEDSSPVAQEQAIASRSAVGYRVLDDGFSSPLVCSCIPSHPRLHWSKLLAAHSTSHSWGTPVRNQGTYRTDTSAISTRPRFETPTHASAAASASASASGLPLAQSRRGTLPCDQAVLGTFSSLAPCLSCVQQGRQGKTRQRQGRDDPKSPPASPKLKPRPFPPRRTNPQLVALHSPLND
ncbi:hypothetical protein GQ607_005202 [Colletotrichum asianum]|uniref:Uncharacterized protein n=1 Tax=Colletotrichum asianum TaxID=702518 RepID=A0A8H3WGK7_9PEZI|nr:hypothetical protein GQ607_005202 [Colletotrichum asianum]